MWSFFKVLKYTILFDLHSNHVSWGQGRYYFSLFKEEEIEPQRRLKDLLEVRDLGFVSRGAAL